MALDWYFGYTFNTGIVGESNYQKNLDKCFNSPNTFHKGNSGFIDVDLVFEPDNPFDESAVAVISDFGKIGYLSRKDAINYHKICNGDYSTKSVRCKIYGGRDSKKIYGAWIDIDFNDEDLYPIEKEHWDEDQLVTTPPPLTHKNNTETNEKTISLLLFLSIVFIPYIFAWFTLGQGYSRTLRRVSFVWMIFFIIVIVIL